MEEFDVIVLGTGLKECVLSALLSQCGKKVLHLDRSTFYGGESSSVSHLEELYRRFKTPGSVQVLGRGSEWNIDLIPKFFLANGELVKLLLQTDVTKYLDFKVVEGCFCCRGGKLHKVPTSEEDVHASDLLGMFDKRRFWKLLLFCLNFDERNPRTFQDLDPHRTSTRDLFARFHLGSDVAEVIGHAVALHSSDSYLDRPSLDTIRRIGLYWRSLTRNRQSPFLFPLFGLRELPHGFARLNAESGGSFLLNRPVDEILMEQGRVRAVRSGGKLFRCKQLVCEPSYVPGRVRRVGRVVRATCLLNHPVKNTGDANSCHIIIPRAQLNRKSDIYISVVSSGHNVASAGMFIATVSTSLEGRDPELEVRPGLDLLEPVLQTFISVRNLLVPNDDGKRSQIFVSRSFDATNHFESEAEDILDLYRRITGAELSFTCGHAHSHT